MINLSVSTKNKFKKFLWLPVILLLEVFVLAGCKKGDTKIVFTVGFDEDVVFKIEDITCTKSEIMVYLVNTENVYDEVFGENIWKVPYKEGTVEDQYKEAVLARLAQIKAMNLFARDKGITLDDKEIERVEGAANEYYSSLSNEEKNLLSVDEDTIKKMYSEFAIANKLYATVTEEVNPEISDDEARTVTVRSILIKTYSIDSAGNRIDFSPEMKDDALKRAYEIDAKIKSGEEFEILQADYNEDEKASYSFSRGIMPKELEDVAFNMSEGEVSGVIATEYGYHIIKCITNFDEEQTDLNKEVIVKGRKQETFTGNYDSYISSLTSSINMDLWKSITYVRENGVTTTDFFEVYDKYFS
ncbi:MAG: peptidylprolyl isomerase [Lachnospiraceae bacterium]|nr:peptidylprolyl isomerase [Lachnospiraceae bacterium]